MEFSLDMTLLVVALGLSGYLVAHLFRGPAMPLLCTAQLHSTLDSPLPDKESGQLATNPRLLFVRRKIAPKERSRSLDDSNSLSFLFVFDTSNHPRRNGEECIPLYNLLLICWRQFFKFCFTSYRIGESRSFS
ncbi:hypothetical protein NDK47_09260 [Brevibacillus ruminantium]|uniref:Uncharacterized protein n=1 Tax=Brevibacillus ruminantium TaxID=2950604 RepID=A0ABY4WN06_9BACL|nr:hypothetical protein [Brevibacillus ruminantium]USG67442.1 hypothetical protein NDK47_09260 [Brevibacillus ruminantium]